MEKLKPSFTAGGNVKRGGRCRKGWQSLKQLHTEFPYEPTAQLSGMEPEELIKRCSRRHLATNVHSSTSHNSQRWKQPKRLPVDEWANLMWHSYHRYCLVTKSDGGMTHATPGANLENSLLSRRRQSRRLHVACHVQDRQVHRNKQTSGGQGQGEGGRQGLLRGYSFPSQW